MKTVKNTIMLFMIIGLTFASDQRVAAMGGNVGFLADDDQSYTMFPAAINHLDYIQVSGAGTGNGSVGLVWGEETTWGFSFDGAGDTDGNDMINLLWGNGTYGVSLGIGSSQYNSGVEGANDMTSLGINAGFGMNMGFGEIGVDFSNSSSDDGMDTTDDPSNMNFNLNLRRDMNVWLFEKMLVNFSYMDASNNAPTMSTMTETVNFFGMEMDVEVPVWDADGSFVATNSMGLDLNLFTPLNVSDNVNGIFALGFGFNSGKHTDYVAVEEQELDEYGNETGEMVVTGFTAEGAVEKDMSIITLPSATLGVEADVTDWAAVRFGMNHSYVVSGTNGDVKWRGATDYEGNSNFGWAFGLGFDYGSFTLDMVVEEALFNNPVHYVTGRNVDPLSTSASITWKF